MGRYVLLNETSESAQAALSLIETMADVVVLDRTDDRALLVEAAAARAAELAGMLPGWTLHAETRLGRSRPPFPRRDWQP